MRPTETIRETETLEVLRFAARFYHDQLTRSAAGAQARRYLEARGVRPETIHRFGLGYAPDKWRGLYHAALHQGFSPETLEAAGLIRERRDGRGYFDLFRGRIMFPYVLKRGEVLGFGARALKNGPDVPRYINTQATEHFNKGVLLWGLYQAREAIREAGEAVVVEGYTDALTLHQAGILNVVATGGASLTPGQATLLRPRINRVLLLFDGDEAGQIAAESSIDPLLSVGIEPSVVSLPRGEDPDSFVRTKGAGRIKVYLTALRQDFVAFRLRRTGSSPVEEKVNQLRAACYSVALIQQEETRHRYTEDIARLSGIRRSVLQQEVESAIFN